MKTRFCPSPTGLMHLGNVRTAFFNFLCAQSTIIHIQKANDNIPAIINNKIKAIASPAIGIIGLFI